MKFVEKKTHKTIRRNSPKCLINWMWTIQNAQYLWYVLQASGFSSFNLKHINQDIVENCFSQIRDNGHRNINPSPFQFSAAFKTLVTTNLTSNYCISSNCEESNEGASLALTKIYNDNELMTESEKNDIDIDIECTEAAISDVMTKHMFTDAQKIILIIAQNKAVTECKQCFEIINHNRILEHIQHALDVAELQFPQFCHETQVKEKLKTTFNNEIPTSILHCSIVYNIVIEETAKEFVLQWCKFINNILTGKIQKECWDANVIYTQAKTMSLKYSKNKK